MNRLGVLRWPNYAVIGSGIFDCFAIFGLNVMCGMSVVLLCKMYLNGY